MKLSKTVLGLGILGAGVVAGLLIWFFTRGEFNNGMLADADDRLVKHELSWAGRGKDYAQYNITLWGEESKNYNAVYRIPASIERVPGLVLLHTIENADAVLELLTRVENTGDCAILALNMAPFLKRDGNGKVLTDNSSLGQGMISGLHAIDLAIEFVRGHSIVDTAAIHIVGLDEANIFVMPAAVNHRVQIKGVICIKPDAITRLRNWGKRDFGSPIGWANKMGSKEALFVMTGTEKSEFKLYNALPAMAGRMNAVSQNTTEDIKTAIQWIWKDRSRGDKPEFDPGNPTKDKTAVFRKVKNKSTLMMNSDTLVKKTNTKTTVAVAMSGGVDSAVAAALLKQQGYEVIGLTMHLWKDEKGGELSLNRSSGCCSINMAKDAAAVADRMGFRHYVLNLSKEFHSTVVENFGAEYFAGRTPNPCVRCNTFIKWQTLLERAKLMGCDYLATGHYARTMRSGARFILRKSSHTEKDQSYALWGLSQESLSRTMFPVGELEKLEVRRIARDLDLAPADHPESQDICFVPDDDYRRFINDNFISRLKLFGQGEIVGPEGDVLGYHNGIVNYTIGQRRGLGISAERPLYVTRIDAQQNRVHVDWDENCVAEESFVREVNWVSMEPSHEPFRCTAKIRYRDEGHAATVFPEKNNTARVKFDKPVRAITPGQSAVFYNNDIVLAGGLLYIPQDEGEES